MVNPRSIITITKKELRSFFDSPMAYIVLVVFLLLWELLFFRHAFLVGQASLRIMFDFLPWLLLILVPAITMNSLAQEKSEGTLELLLTHPLRDIELLIGKFLGSWGFVTSALLFVFPMAVALNRFGDLDWGVVGGQFLGSALMAAVLVALGLFVSSLVASPIAALLVTVVGSFLLVVAGFELVTAGLPLFLAPVLERLSVLSHFESMARGVIDGRDLIYFLSATLIFLGLAYLQFLKRKFGNHRAKYLSYQLWMVVFIGAAVLANMAGARIPGRIDLTEGQMYTLTPGTREILAEIDGEVAITLFASRELPAQLQPTLREVKDVLRDYQTLGLGRVVVAQRDPATSPETAQQAVGAGVQEVQFNVVDQGGFQVRTGWLGLTIAYGEESEALPFIQNTSDLEYQLTGAIKKLTTIDKKKVVFLSGQGEKSLFDDYRGLTEELRKQFVVETALITEEEPTLPENIAVLVVAGALEEPDEIVLTAIHGFLDAGGAALFLVDGITINEQFMSVSTNPGNLADLLGAYGVVVQSDLVYDLRSHETVGFGSGAGNYLLPYPLWVRAGVADGSVPLTARLQSVVFPWASSLGLDEIRLAERDLVMTTLLATTEFAGRQTENLSLNPQQPFSQEDLERQTLAVSLAGAEESSTPRLVVVGDSDFLTNQFIGNAPENLAFGLEAISWLGQEESLAGIRLKQMVDRRLVFENETQVMLVKYGNLALALLVPLALGASRLLRRRALRQLTYASGL